MRNEITELDKQIAHLSDILEKSYTATGSRKKKSVKKYFYVIKDGAIRMRWHLRMSNNRYVTLLNCRIHILQKLYAYTLMQVIGFGPES